jgi:pimeloyl-ACP methyl ester carboxylesterase
MSLYSDGYWWSHDDLRLHYRDYAGPSDKPPIICIPGLTRNCRDWEPVAERLAGQWRVITVSLRGRGESAYAKDALTYVPLTYMRDIERLLIHLDISRFVLFGTSLGGIVTMLMAANGGERIAGALINDVGPEIDPVGLERIKTYVGRSVSWPTWLHAARALHDANGALYPKFQLADWLAMAKRVHRLTQSGRIVPDYDAKIAIPFKLPNAEPAFDMWPTLDGLAGKPVLIVRGALSDLLSEATARRMTERLPDAKLVTVPDVGHAPVLNEPEAVAGIDALLQAVADWHWS